MSPVGTVASANQAILKLCADEQFRCKVKQGRPPLGVEMRLTDDEGESLPHDGATFGRLKVRGPCVAQAYWNSQGVTVLDEQGFFDTGDVATIDQRTVCCISSIGPRTSSNPAANGSALSPSKISTSGHPRIALATAIGVPHPKWGERPILFVKVKAGQSVGSDEILHFLSTQMAKWWVPDQIVFVDDIPLGPTGKIDKKAMRQRFDRDMSGGF